VGAMFLMGLDGDLFNSEAVALYAFTTG